MSDIWIPGVTSIGLTGIAALARTLNLDLNALLPQRLDMRATLTLTPKRAKPNAPRRRHRERA
jgi:hypothetical protein